LYENLVRMNNAVTYIPDNCGIDPQAFGGLPGEVHVINAQSQPPTTVWPTANFPVQAIQMPELLLNKQKELQVFTPPRMAEPGAGNLSPELYNASIYQSKPLTRLRGRLMAESVYRLTNLTFYMMAKFYKQNPQWPDFPQSSQDQFQMTSWSDISGEMDDYTP